MANGTGVKNRRLLITKNSILMLVMLVIIFLAIFAWYYNNKNVSATSISLNAALPEDVEIAYENNGKIGNIVNGTWTAGAWGITANFNGPFQFSNDVTSDGETFIIPAFSSTEDNPDAKADARTKGKIVNVNGVPKTGSQVKTNLDNINVDEGETADYVKIPFYLRSRSKDLYVKSSAYLSMEAENAVSGTAKTGSNSIRKSAYGNFTSDALVAAMRVSLTGGPVDSIGNDNTATVTAAEKKTFVWLPRPDLFLNIPDMESEDNWTLQGTDEKVTKTTSLSRIGKPFPIGSTYKHNYYAPRKDNDDNVIGVTLVEDPSVENKYTPQSLAGEDSIAEQESNAYKSDIGKTKTLSNGSVPTLGVSKVITGFQTSASPIPMAKTDGSGNADFYVYKFYLNIWIEGTDSEARRAMDTGMFRLHIEFGNSAD